jgi:putative transposase
MSYFRRARLGSSYFFTVIAFRRRPVLCDDVIRHALRDAFVRTRTRLPFAVDAMVLLPDHLHCIWTLPEDDFDYSARWAQIKHHVSYVCRDRYGIGARSQAQRGKRESLIWQRRFYEHMIRNENDMERHADYIHFNPVKHGLVERVAAWPHSTFHRYVRNGVYAEDWGGTKASRDMMLE